MGALQFCGIAATVFGSYPLPLAWVLRQAFAVGLPLQTAFPLHSLLIVHDIPDSFIMDDALYSYAFVTLYKYASVDLRKTIFAVFRLLSYDFLFILL